MKQDDNVTSNKTQTTTIGGGCFWCIEAVYDEIDGVVKVISGYSGGSTHNPTYEAVCTGTTGHIEVVQITFIPEIISFDEILEVFFNIHDPTTLDRQGADIGSQYRSVIFYHDIDQATVAEQKIRDIDEARVWADLVVTQVSELSRFYFAEEYHQDYYKKNPYQGYCQVIIQPKLLKFRKQYIDKLKK